MDPGRRLHLYSGEAEPGAFAAALSDSMWLLVGLCAAGTILTWAFVRGSHDTAVEAEHQAHRHFHLPWVASTMGRNRAIESSTRG